MTATKPTFKPLDFGAAAAVDEFAQKNNIPTIVFPKGAEGKGSETVTPPAVVHAKRPRKGKASVSATPGVQRLAVELPAYLVDAVADEAHHTKSTIRYVIVKALKDAGYFVADEDLKEDGRRGR